MATLTYTKTGTKASANVKLDNEIFGIEPINHQLIHQAYDSYLANGRVNLARTKTRGEVKGSGRKPWRQKGTGRARVGSRRTPLWRGGGIVFGPTGHENYSKRLGLQTKRNAIRQALSAANKAGNIRVIEEIALKNPGTGELTNLLKKIDVKGYTLMVSNSVTKNLQLAARNLDHVKVIDCKYLNVARIIDADTIILTKPAVEQIVNWLKPIKRSK